MPRILIIAVLLVLVIIGCTPVETPTAAPGNTPSGTTNEPTPTAEGVSDVTGDPGSGFGIETGLQGSGFEAVIDGAMQATMTGPGYYACENSMYVIRPLPDGLQQVTLILPANIVPGVYRLVDMGGSGPAATVSFSDGQVYAGRVNGVLVLNSVATGAGQSVSGNFDFTASNGAGEVSARGEFDFTSQEGVLYCVP